MNYEFFIPLTHMSNQSVGWAKNLEAYLALHHKEISEWMMMQYNITVVIKNDKLTTPKATLPSDTSKKRKIKKNSPNQFRLSGKCKVILDIPMATLNFNWGKKKKKISYCR